MKEAGRDLAPFADLFARRPRFRAGRGRLAVYGRRVSATSISPPASPSMRSVTRIRIWSRRSPRRRKSSGTPPTCYRIPEGERLAARLCELSFADFVFFQNSGTEAMECAIKMARKYQSASGRPERYRIVTFEGAFHGRTLAALAATGNKKYLDGFGPPMPGFDQVAVRRSRGGQEGGRPGDGGDHHRAGDGRGRRARRAAQFPARACASFATITACC